MQMIIITLEMFTNIEFLCNFPQSISAQVRSITATYSEIKYFGQLCDKEGAGVGRDIHGSLDPQLILKTTILSEKNELEYWVLVYLTLEKLTPKYERP